MLQITISKRAAIIIALALVLVIPGVAGATHYFADVEDGSTHAPGIEWVADAGVTAGCGDGTNYCPDDNVTRAQMGTFMCRLSGNCGVDPSVNATQLDGLDSSNFQRSEVPPFGTVYGTIGAQENNLLDNDEISGNSSLPIPAPVGLTDETVTVAGGLDDTDGACTGTAQAPTADPGFVCIYPYSDNNVDSLRGFIWGSGDGINWGFQLSAFNDGNGSTSYVYASWAYTAPLDIILPLSDGDTATGVGGN